MIDFAALPPEINSARMYSGPGSAPMMAAASAWNALAAELGSAAASYASVVSTLAGDQWLGPASASMAAAVAPYVSWMSAAAAQAEKSAAQAVAAAGAFEAAFAGTVPPPLIAANRAQLMALIATNILGQNTPAIMATEAHYMEMWAQDAAAMYGYAGASSAATQLIPFSQPPQTTSLTGLAAQSAAVGQAAATSAGSQQSTLSQLIFAVPSALQGLASPTLSGTGAGGVLDGLDVFSSTSASSTTGLSGLLNTVSGSNGSALGQFLNAGIWNDIFSSGFFMPGNYLGNASDLMNMGGQATSQAAGDAAGAAEGAAASAADGAAAAAAGPLSGLGGVGNSVSAGLGQGALIGPLSVPPSWTASAPLHSPLAPTLGGTPMIAPQAAGAGMPGMPGMPMGNFGAQGFGRAIPQYGFRPRFVAHPPAAG
jgi:PPE-repeat protein